MGIFFQFVVFFTFLKKDNNFKQFVVEHIVMHKNGMHVSDLSRQFI